MRRFSQQSNWNNKKARVNAGITGTYSGKTCLISYNSYDYSEMQQYRMVNASV